MEIEVREVEDNKIVKLRAKYLGIVTPLEAREMRKCFESLHGELAPGATVAIDMSEIDYMNSSGLGVLVEMSTTFHKQGNKVVLYGIKDGVMKVIHLMGLDRVLAISKNEDTLMSSISAGVRDESKSDDNADSGDRLRLSQ